LANGLKYLHSYRDRHGKLRHAFRRPGFKTVPLHGAPGSVELMQAYTNALAAASAAPQVEIGASRSKPGSVAAAVALYFSSMAFGSLAPSTQCARRWALEKFREHYGDQRFAELRREHVELMLGRIKPHTARNFLKALRGVIAVAMTAGLRTDDPTAGIRVRVRASAGFKTWSEDAIAQFESRHPIASKARLAFGLLVYTAQRRGDVIHMGRQHVKDGFMRVVQQKTGAVLEIPIIPELREILAAQPADHLTFLTTRV
jgi:integrase